jgi:DNA-binding MarR family transcriptional regulator
MSDPPEHARAPEQDLTTALLSDLGFCGHYLHFHRGGRSGRAHILCRLLRHGGEMPQRDLQESFGLKAGSLSEVLAKAEEQGLVERTRIEGDRRQLVVRLTPAGHEAAVADLGTRETFASECFSCLSTTEQEDLLVMLDKIRNHWETLDD